jgi:peptidyl-prolyl cis-trans isomerase SurA
MKNIIFVTLFLIGTSHLYAQKDVVVMEINGKPITKNEFLQIYLKNNNDPKYDKASLDEYIELFKNFKLKVAEAESLGYDSVPKLRRELDGYRKTLSTPYLVDNTKNEELVIQAYERLKNEIRASHILVKVSENASPTDTLKAFAKIKSLKKRIENGEKFEDVAKSGSEDPSASQNGGDLGYFTAFQMVYPFEEAAYTTPVGKISEPVRTRFGYHILQVVDKRPARGTMKAAHLMIAVGKEDPQDEIDNAKRKIDEIYQKLVQGENFEELVYNYSDDPSSVERGGVLPLFGSGTSTRMLPEFEEEAFKLKNNGDFTKAIFNKLRLSYR